MQASVLCMAGCREQLGPLPPMLPTAMTVALICSQDPVINSAGHVYERSALEEHFRRGHTSDPLTNQPLDSGNLIPVYALKSRSFEFRERVAKACVEKVRAPWAACAACSTKRWGGTPWTAQWLLDCGMESPPFFLPPKQATC